MNAKLCIETFGPGIIDITGPVTRFVQDSHVQTGVCTLFIQHTSASILIQENFEPSVKHDLINWLNKLVPESDEFTHTSEGPDDMPSHIKAALLPTNLVIPIEKGSLVLGQYQGIFLWEHRKGGKKRQVHVHISKEEYYVY